MSTEEDNRIGSLTLHGIITGCSANTDEIARKAASLVRSLISTIISTGCTTCNVHVAFHKPTARWLVALCAIVYADSKIPIDDDWARTIESSFRNHPFIAPGSVSLNKVLAELKEPLNRDWSDGSVWERGTLVYFYHGYEYFLQLLGMKDREEEVAFRYVTPSSLAALGREKDWRDSKVGDLGGLLERISPELV
ncbi:hypothetical protein BDW74DRAFT_171974 [Aspergillus multicolor]|uniref:uncharacterized protein n=1 Tax=Aspergillus multicolor TaxID=41759 RepID=UPI003CCCF49B